FVGLWNALRWDPAKWQLDIERLVEEAQRAGLCTCVYLEREPLRAEVCEHAPSPTRVGVGFVPESKVLRSTLMAEQLIGGERMWALPSPRPPAPFHAPPARPPLQPPPTFLVIPDQR